MPFWSRLFGAKDEPAPAAKAEEYKGFRITLAPGREGGQYRVGAVIEKDGKRHTLIRADTMASLDDVNAISLAKAKQMIDEQGERLFG